jgi:hypothetical protein
MARGSEEIERISGCCERESYWYFIYIVQGNGVERDHRAWPKKGGAGEGTDSIEEAAAD